MGWPICAIAIFLPKSPAVVIEQLETVGNQLAEKHLSSAKASRCHHQPFRPVWDPSESAIAETLSLSVAVDLHARLVAPLAPERQVDKQAVLADPGRRSRSSQGMSVIPPAPEQTTRMVLP
jgi:hypothetical protein